MKVLTITTSTDQFNNGGCDYGLIDLTPALAATVLERMATACSLRAADISLHELHYWDCGIAFLTAAADSGWNADFPDDSQPYVLLPADTAIPEAAFRRTEYDHMVIAANGDDPDVFWRASPKNSSVYVETVELPHSLIERALLEPKEAAHDPIQQFHATSLLSPRGDCHPAAGRH